MDIRTFSMLVSGMDQIRAEEHMLLMDAISYPHMTEKARSKHHKKWSKQAYPENFVERIVKTTDLELI